MSLLTPRERELVSLGAAMGSNCVACIEHHIPVSRKVGLTDLEISEAIRLADTVRQVPARKALHTALDLLSECSSLASPHAVGASIATLVAPDKPCCG
jgi:4-carboxymuconolactone decarboxylase